MYIKHSKFKNTGILFEDKWYKKPWVGVVGGVVGTIITIHVIDYSLPR